MMDNRSHLLLLALAAFLLGTGIYFGKELPGDLKTLHNRPLRNVDSTATVRLSLINTAVNEVPSTTYFEYTGGFQNPFKLWNVSLIQRKSRKGGTSSKKVARQKLVLKGILTKHKPLAILEDGMGETYIRGIGEKAIDQTVVAIAKNQVTMRDNRGTYVLVVEEN